MVKAYPPFQGPTNRCLQALSLIREDNPRETLAEMHKKIKGKVSKKSRMLRLRRACSYYVHQAGYSFQEVSGVVGYKTHDDSLRASRKYQELIDSGKEEELTVIGRCNINLECLDALSIMHIPSRTSVLRVLRTENHQERYEDSNLAQIRMRLAFWLRDLSLNPGKITYFEISEAAGYFNVTETKTAIKKYEKIIDENMQELEPIKKKRATKKKLTPVA